jgi:hypothetical protein
MFVYLPLFLSLIWDYTILLTYTYRRDREVSGNLQTLSYLIILQQTLLTMPHLWMQTHISIIRNDGG